MKRRTAGQTLSAMLTPTDHLGVTEHGDLRIEECSATDLVAEYGSPLFVVSEATLRANYRRIFSAFARVWPAPVQILYAIKANNNLAVRSVLYSEGAGSDCFGSAEMYATFMGGADPAKVVVNGSNKTKEELVKAIELGVTVNIDAEEEVETVDVLANAAGRTANVNLRLKIAPSSYADKGSDYFGLETGLDTYLQREKWGFSAEVAIELVRQIAQCRHIRHHGFSLHVGRVSAQPEMYALWAGEAASVVARIIKATGFVPTILDIGGGWARERDPESRSLALNPHTIETYAEVVSASLLQVLLREKLAIPYLWLEVGRYLVGNAVCLLGTVGAIKRDLGQTWINVDCSTNTLMRVDTANSRYHLFAATNMGRPIIENAHIVGPTCIDSLLAEHYPMPSMKRGDLIAVLDTGMYAETTSTQFNGMPRPATVLVSGRSHELIKRRETVEDIFALHRIPERLRISPGNRP
jgi:diaminopimelate decarboxylase